MESHRDKDTEKSLTVELEVSPSDQDTATAPGFLAKIRYYEQLLDRKLGIESVSIARVHPEDRKPPNPLVMALMWASGTMNLSCFSTGFLGVEYGLSLGQTIPIIICASLLGSAVPVCIPFFHHHCRTVPVRRNWMRTGFRLKFDAFLGLVRHDGPRNRATTSRHFQILIWLLPILDRRCAERNSAAGLVRSQLHYGRPRAQRCLGWLHVYRRRRRRRGLC